MQKITPHLWFDNNAEEAMQFYTSIFPNSKIGKVHRLGEIGPEGTGNVITGTFEIMGQEFMVLNAGPMFKFNEAISFYVNCEDQKEVDYYWEKLIAEGGSPSQCGWLKDKFGLSWQIVPAALGRLMGDKDPKKAKRVLDAMMKMGKLEVAELERAAAGK